MTVFNGIKLGTNYDWLSENWSSLLILSTFWFGKLAELLGYVYLQDIDFNCSNFRCTIFLHIIHFFIAVSVRGESFGTWSSGIRICFRLIWFCYAAFCPKPAITLSISILHFKLHISCFLVWWRSSAHQILICQIIYLYAVDPR